jgi:hypothetical protein
MALRYNVERLKVKQSNVKQLNVKFYNVEQQEIDRLNVEHGGTSNVFYNTSPDSPLLGP